MTVLALAIAVFFAAQDGAAETVVQPGESLADVARRTLGDARAAEELKALNPSAPDRPQAGATLKLPGPDRQLALSALTAARQAVRKAESTADRREEAARRLDEAERLFKSARYVEAAKAADGAWQLVSASAREPTRFEVKVEDDGRTTVSARSGQPVRVEAEGATQPVYAGQTVKVEKGKPPSPPEAKAPPPTEPPQPIQPPPKSPSSLSAPALLSPAEDGKVKPEGKAVTLSWKAVPGASGYEVELSGAKQVTLAVARSTADVELPAGRYVWTVRAVARGQKSEPSKRRAFEVVEGEVKLDVGKATWK